MAGAAILGVLGPHQSPLSRATTLPITSSIRGSASATVSATLSGSDRSKMGVQVSGMRTENPASNGAKGRPGPSSAPRGTCARAWCSTWPRRTRRACRGLGVQPSQERRDRGGQLPGVSGRHEAQRFSIREGYMRVKSLDGHGFVARRLRYALRYVLAVACGREVEDHRASSSSSAALARASASPTCTASAAKRAHIAESTSAL